MIYLPHTCTGYGDTLRKQTLDLFKLGREWLLDEMPPKKTAGGGKMTKEEERLLLESSRHVTKTTSALFYGNAFIIAALPLCEYEHQEAQGQSISENLSWKNTVYQWCDLGMFIKLLLIFYNPNRTHHPFATCATIILLRVRLWCQHNPFPILSHRAVLACSDDGPGHLCYPLRCPHHSQHLAYCIFISQDQSSPQAQVRSIICTFCLLVNFQLLAGLIVSLWSACVYPPPTKNLAEAWCSCVQRSGGRAQCLWKEAHQSRERWEVCIT